MELEAQAFSDNANLISFTDMEVGKWMPLLYLDEIKERNKPKINEQVQLKIPFFLDFENIDTVREQMQEE